MTRIRRLLVPRLALAYAATACSGTGRDVVSPPPAESTVASFAIGQVLPFSTGPQWVALVDPQYATVPSRLPFTDPWPLEARGVTATGGSEVRLATQPTAYTSSDTTVVRVVAGHLVIVGYGSAAVTAFMPDTATFFPHSRTSFFLTVTQ